MPDNTPAERGRRLVECDCQTVDLCRSSKELEEMNTLDRGLKHICPKCAAKYYDLRKVLVACPLCGAKTTAAKVPKVAQPASKAGRRIFGRFP